MAKLWITYREGLRLFGAVAAEVPANAPADNGAS